MQQVERLNQQLTERVWEQYLRGKGDTTAMSVDFASNNAQPDEMWTPALSEAIRNNHVVQNREPTGQTIAVPLRVHGQVIGAMEFELGDDGALSPEELGLIQQVGERFGMAVENARLYEESQRVAQREALVNEISARLQSTNNVEAVLAEAARSLQQSLNAGKVSIRLGTPPAQNKRRNGAR
jgi:GAF domain-containing protein